MAEHYTVGEWYKLFLKENTPAERLKLDKLYDERDACLSNLQPGDTTYLVKYKPDHLIRYVNASAQEQAVQKLGYSLFDCRLIPIEVGLAKKSSMSEEVKEHLKQLNKERKELRNASSEKKQPKVPVIEKKKESKTARDGSAKAAIIQCIKKEKEIGRDGVIGEIFKVLKQRATEKGTRSDDEHIQTRAKLSYYFYKREANAS